MTKKDLEELFCTKVGMELVRFKQKILKQRAEEIFANAYRIDCMVTIYERLLEIKDSVSLEGLRELLVFPNLLAFLYSRWLNQEDSVGDEMQHSLEESIAMITDVDSTIAQEEGKVA